MDGVEMAQAPGVASRDLASQMRLLVHVITAGIVGAGVVVTYLAMTMWVLGWHENPKFAAFEWQQWLLLSALGIGQVCILGAIALAVTWFVQARRHVGALLWGTFSSVAIGITFVAVVATVIQSVSFGD